MAKLDGSGKPFWPSASNRYCTSDHKRDQADKNLRQFSLVVSVEGIRADESDTRKKKWPVHLRKQICAAQIKPFALKPKDHTFEENLIALDQALELWLSSR